MTAARSSKSLGELFRVGSSKRVLQSQWQSEGVPFYRGREITLLAAEGFVNNALFISEDLYTEFAAKNGVPSAGDIMITAIGTIGNSYIVQNGDRFYFKDASVLWLKKTTEVSSEFINWWLKSPLFSDQLDRGNGATVDTLTIQKLQAVTVDLPSLAEQQRIVTLLDEAFDGIATARVNAEQNLQNARALFESHLQSVFSQRGNGWVETTLGSMCTFSSGGTPSKANSSYWKGNIPWVSGRDMKAAQLSDSALHISQAAIDETSTRMAPAGSLLVLVRGMGLAHGLQLAELTVPCAFNQDIKAILPDSKIVPRFLLLALKTRVAQSKSILSNAAHGTLKIDMGDLKSVPISLPPYAEQQRIVQGVDILLIRPNKV